VKFRENFGSKMGVSGVDFDDFGKNFWESWQKWSEKNEKFLEIWKN